MSAVLAEDLPSELRYGYVRARILLAVADSDDEDRKPDGVAASGTVTFSPVSTLIRGTDEPFFVINTPITATISADGGPSHRPGDLTHRGQPGVWLVEGRYTASFNVTGAKIPSFQIDVSADHTDESPLWLSQQIPITPSPAVKFVINEQVYLDTIAAAERAELAATGVERSAITGIYGAEGNLRIAWGGGEDVVIPLPDAVPTDTGFVVSPTAYGAVGDGTADDTDALVAAVDSVAANGGTLVIDKPIRATRRISISSQSAARKTVEFTGDGSIFADFDTNAHAVIHINGATNVNLTNVDIRGRGPGESQSYRGVYGVAIADSTDVSISGGWIRNCHREGIRVDRSTNVTVDNVRVTDVSFAFLLGAVQINNSVDVVITRVRVENSGWKGISASGCTRVTYSHCTVEGIVTGDALFMGGCKDFHITNNHVSNMDGPGDAIKISTQADNERTHVIGSSDGVISGNLIHDIRNGGGGIRLTASQRILVSHNTISNISEYMGMNLSSLPDEDVYTDDIHIVGNTIRNTSTRGIGIYNARRVQVVGGNVFDTIPITAVRVEGVSVEVVVMNNVMRAIGNNRVAEFLSTTASGYVGGNYAPGGAVLNNSEDVVVDQ